MVLRWAYLLLGLGIYSHWKPTKLYNYNMKFDIDLFCHSQVISKYTNIYLKFDDFFHFFKLKFLLNSGLNMNGEP